jgi:para-nitrobenzyl esterase
MINRRSAVKGLAALGFTLSGTRWANAATDGAQPSDVIKTTHGPVRGSIAKQIVSFRGIPYGSPTGGDARFLPAKAPTAWAAVRDATAYGDSCPQLGFGVSPFAKSGRNEPPPPPSAIQKQLSLLFPRDKPETYSENCLVLNVWTPATDAKRRPVMVWLHGGGFAQGSGSSSMFDGTRLAQRGDVVVVTINHRLNVFGYLYLGEIAGEAYASSGNLGMLDIVAALSWVRDNIGAFGGDPGNVTIFGESGGAGKVSVLCAMPAAQGLFHKAIMQSGPALRVSDTSHGTAIARQLLKDLGLGERDVAALRRVDADKLTRAADEAERKVVPRIIGVGPMGMSPIIDAVVLKHHPFDAAAPPESAQVPFLVGSNQDESVLFLGGMPDWGRLTDADVLERIRPVVGARSEAALQLYKRLYPTDSASYLFAAITTDAWMRRAANRVGELKVQQQAAPVYTYVLDWQVTPDLRTPHALDVPLVFDNVQSTPGTESAPGAQAVADQMSAAWIAFAHTGNPNTAALPHWPAYSLPDRANMVFNVKSRVVSDYGKTQREFWDKGPT